MPQWSSKLPHSCALCGVSGHRCQQGSTSLVCVVLVLPLLVLLLVTTIDLANFFAIREEVRAILDQEAQMGLSRGATKAQVELSARNRLAGLTEFIGQPSIDGLVSRDTSVLSLRGEYKGILIKLVGELLRMQMPALSVDLEVRSRRLISEHLVLFDRSVASAESVCVDAELRATTTFVAALVKGLEAAGSRSVNVGFFPGTRKVIEVLDSQGEVKGCDGSPLRASTQVSVVPGVVRSLPSSLDLGAEIERFLLTRRSSSPSERLGVVTIVRGVPAGNGYIHSAVDQLDAMSRRNQLFLNMAHFAVNPRGSYRRPSYRPGYYGVRLREVLLEARQLSDPRLVVASIGHLGNDVHISR